MWIRSDQWLLRYSSFNFLSSSSIGVEDDTSAGKKLFVGTVPARKKQEDNLHKREVKLDAKSRTPLKPQRKGGSASTTPRRIPKREISKGIPKQLLKFETDTNGGIQTKKTILTNSTPATHQVRPSLVFTNHNNAGKYCAQPTTDQGLDSTLGQANEGNMDGKMDQ